MAPPPHSGYPAEHTPGPPPMQGVPPVKSEMLANGEEEPEAALPPVELNPPQATLYVTNVDWTLTKAQIRRSLFTLFSRHGKVLNVIYLRHTGMAGRAFVIFDSVDLATKALEEEQDFVFFDRPLRINYAKETSDITLKREKEYTPVDQSEKRQKRKELRQKRHQGGSQEQHMSGLGPHDIPAGAPSAANPAPRQPPSHILLAINLPSLENPEFMLSMLARQYPGFKEVKLPGPGMALLIFDSPTNATAALVALQGYKITESDALSLTFSLNAMQ
jgi:U2 small nuclear ribonucleoprotein B''